MTANVVNSAGTAIAVKVRADVTTVYEMMVYCDDDEAKENVGRLTDKLDLATLKEFGDVITQKEPENVRLVELHEDEEQAVRDGQGGLVFNVDGEGELS